MKALAAYICLFLLLLFSSSHLVFTTYVKSQKKIFRLQSLSQNKEEIKQLKMPMAMLYTDQKGMEWKEKNKELVIAGVYHEVLKIVPGKNIAVLYLIADHAENALFSRYFALLCDQPFSLPALLLQFMLLQFVPLAFGISALIRKALKRIYAQPILKLAEAPGFKAIKPPAA